MRKISHNIPDNFLMSSKIYTRNIKYAKTNNVNEY